MDKNQIQGLLFYFEHSAELDPGIQDQVIEVLNAVINMIEEQEAAKKKKRKSPNKSGILQIDIDTNKIVGEFNTQKEALIALNKEGKSGIGDALNGRTKTHISYGYRWYFKDEYDKFLAENKAQ